MDETTHVQYVEEHDEESYEDGEQYPVEELVPPSVRYGSDPQVTGRPLDASIYGYDIAQMAERPWAKSGVDTSDYFNYGFEEESWRAYCALQAQGIQSLRARADKFIADILASHVAAAPPTAAYTNNSSTAGAGQYQQGGDRYRGGEHNAGGYTNRGAGGDGGHQIRERSAFYKTQMCNAYLAGGCTKPYCNYAHGHHELRPYVHTGERPNPNNHAAMPPPVPVPSSMMGGGATAAGAPTMMPPPTMSGMPPPPMGLSMPPPPPPTMGGMPPRPAGEGVLTAPPSMSAPSAPQPVLATPAAPRGPAGFRILPQQKRDREKSPENMTY